MLILLVKSVWARDCGFVDSLRSIRFNNGSGFKVSGVSVRRRRRWPRSFIRIERETNEHRTSNKGILSILIAVTSRSHTTCTNKVLYLANAKYFLFVSSCLRGKIDSYQFSFAQNAQKILRHLCKPMSYKRLQRLNLVSTFCCQHICGLFGWRIYNLSSCDLDGGGKIK